MPLYLSITGNPKLAEEKPEGYYDLSEWNTIVDPDLRDKLLYLRYTDYKELGFLSGRYTEAEYAPIGKIRDKIRKELDELKISND